jgi:hypothetical protein
LKNKLRFDHNFFKIHGQVTAKLISVDIISRTELDAKMVDMDTQYYCNKETHVKGVFTKVVKNYVLSNGLLILLVFLGNDQIPFTTLRQLKDKNLKFYRGRIGQEFDIVIKDGEKKDA